MRRSKSVFWIGDIALVGWGVLRWAPLLANERVSASQADRACSSALFQAFATAQTRTLCTQASTLTGLSWVLLATGAVLVLANVYWWLSERLDNALYKAEEPNDFPPRTSREQADMFWKGPDWPPRRTPQEQADKLWGRKR